MAKRSRTRSFEELVASQEFAEPLGSYTPLPMRTFPELIKSMLDLNRDQMIAVLEQEARHAELSSDARRKVDAYLTANLDRFVAMETAGTLEAYIERCPPN